MRRTLRTASFAVTVLHLNVLTAVASAPVAEVLAGAFVVGLLLLLAWTVAVVPLDALAEILDEDGIGVFDNTHSDASIPSL